MKTLTVRLPEELMGQIEAEARERRVSKSDVVRDRLSPARLRGRRTASLATIGDLIGCVDGLPVDLTRRKRKYLKATGYGRKRPG
jgi:Arc/MetJ-type ribon-helix-helix transcriptional regulator